MVPMDRSGSGRDDVCEVYLDHLSEYQSHVYDHEYEYEFPACE